MPKPIPPEGKKRQRVGLNYASDFDKFFLIRVDLIIDVDTNQYISPATGLFFTRVSLVGSPVSAIPARDFTPRRIEICRLVDDNETVNSIVCPYLEQSNIIDQLKEVINDYPNLRIQLKGEFQPELIERSQI